MRAVCLGQLGSSRCSRHMSSSIGHRGHLKVTDKKVPQTLLVTSCVTLLIHPVSDQPLTHHTTKFSGPHLTIIINGHTTKITHPPTLRHRFIGPHLTIIINGHTTKITGSPTLRHKSEVSPTLRHKFSGVPHHKTQVPPPPPTTVKWSPHYLAMAPHMVPDK